MTKLSDIGGGKDSERARKLAAAIPKQRRTQLRNPRQRKPGPRDPTLARFFFFPRRSHEVFPPTPVCVGTLGTGRVLPRCRLPCSLPDYGELQTIANPSGLGEPTTGAASVSLLSGRGVVA